MTAVALVSAPVRAVARATIATHSKSFALASRVLGPRLRDDVAVLYTWCRRTDDAVDLAAPADAADAIGRLRVEVDAAYRGTATDPIVAAFGELARARAIPRAYPDALVDGMAMDVAGARYHTLDELFTYCWRVAGVVGAMMAHVFGVRDDAALIPAVHLGVAMQLTNICRDVGEDWARGRLYLPDELCARHGAPALAEALDGPLPAAARAPLAASVRELLALADRYYRSADHGIPALPWRAALAVRSARHVYAAIGGRIARQRHDVLAPRAFVSGPGKLARVARAAGRTLAAAPVRAFARRPHVPTRTLELADVPRL